jgi:hypothetical protein
MLSSTLKMVPLLNHNFHFLVLKSKKSTHSRTALLSIGKERIIAKPGCQMNNERLERIFELAARLVLP